MTYSAFDKSVADGAPIEVYEFVAQHATWRLTSYHSAVTIGGNTYEPANIDRTDFEQGPALDSIITMDFMLPVNHEIARTFCYGVSPRKLTVVVSSFHEGDTDIREEYRGEIVGAAAEGHVATIKTQSTLQARINGSSLSVMAVKLCQHTLFDARCKVNRAAYTVTATVTYVAGQLIQVDNQGFAFGALDRGQITNTRTGEAQTIILNDANGVKIGFPFYDIVLGDVVELTQGCNRERLGHCKARFNNVVNYGGFDFVPEVNPFETIAALNLVVTNQTVRKIS